MVGQHVSAAPRHSLRPVRGAPASGFRGSPEGHPSPGSFGPGDVEGPPHLREAPVPTADSKVRPPNNNSFSLLPKHFSRECLSRHSPKCFFLLVQDRRICCSFSISPLQKGRPTSEHELSMLIWDPPTCKAFYGSLAKSCRFS